MIVIKCEVICDICEKHADGTIRMKGAGRINTGLFGVGDTLGEVHTITPSPWKRVGILGDSIVCSDECEKKFNEQTVAEREEHKLAEQLRKSRP